MIEVAKQKEALYSAISEVTHAQTRICLFDNFLRDVEKQLPSQLEVHEIEVDELKLWIEQLFMFLLLLFLKFILVVL